MGEVRIGTAQAWLFKNHASKHVITIPPGFALIMIARDVMPAAWKDHGPGQFTVDIEKSDAPGKFPVIMLAVLREHVPMFLKLDQPRLNEIIDTLIAIDRHYEKPVAMGVSYRDFEPTVH